MSIASKIPAPQAAPLSPSSPTVGALAVRQLDGHRLQLARLAWIGVATLVAVLVIVTVPTRYDSFLHTSGGGLPLAVYASYEIGLFALAVAVFEGVAALLVWHGSGQRMALISALALVTWPAYSSSSVSISRLVPWCHWVGAALAFTGIIALTLAFYLVPDGRFTPRWTRWLIVPWVLLQAGAQFLASTSWDYTTWPELFAALAVAAGLGPAIGVMLYRYRYVLTPVQRRQFRWPMWAVVIAVGVVLIIELVIKLLPTAAQQNLLVRAVADTGRIGAVLLVPLAIALAIARYRLWAIDLLINRTLVYGILTAIAVGLYVVVVGTLGTLLSGRGDVFVSLVATGLVALLFQPLRVYLQRGINRLLYGERDNPYHLISHLGRRLEETLAPEAMLPAVVETVSRALKLPYVAIALPRDGSLLVVAEHGDPVPAPSVLPLMYQQELVGQLFVAPRAGSDSLSPADRRLFADLTRQVAVAVHAGELTAQAVRLSAELQQARSRVVTLREEERRRLRRDLHDGLGPALAAVTLQAETARDLLQSDPVQADAVLADLTEQAQVTIADIRRVVYDLRPPALDDLGLIGAARAHASRLSGQDLSISIDAPEELGPLPAAVEVAAYRIIQESLTNVVRHAQAHTCTVRIRLGEAPGGRALSVDVADDGQGLPEAWHAGVGLQSMRDRAAELCGTLVIRHRTGIERGTHISASLPLVCTDTTDDPDKA